MSLLLSSPSVLAHHAAVHSATQWWLRNNTRLLLTALEAEVQGPGAPGLRAW